jgi:membrane-bound ClpP family serine protease
VEQKYPPREEKEEEKQHEKMDEKSDEKRWEEKFGKDVLSSLTWAAILIWLGIVFLANSLGWWTWFWKVEAMAIGGVGAIILIIAFLRLVLPQFRTPVAGSLVLGVIFLGVAFWIQYGTVWFWPLVLIAVGVVLLVRSLLRPKPK